MRHILAHPLARTLILFILVCMLCAVLVPAAKAQELPTFDVPGVVDLSWTLPMETECLNPADLDPETCARLPLTGALALTSLELYVSTAPIPDDFAGEPTVILEPGRVTTTYTGTVPAGSTLYFRLKARNAYARSRFTTEVSKEVPVPNVAPGVPTNVTVEIKIGVAPATP